MKNSLGFLKRVHFVGIGGIGMSGIAEVLHSLDFVVSGSDLADSATVQRLKKLGITIYEGHKAENVQNVDVLVYSSAVSMDNPEVKVAIESFIPVIPRGEMLAELMRMNYAVAVSGSHGKTTTTSMVSDILSNTDYDPTTIIGGRLNSINSSAKLGTQNVMVAEADESDRSFLMLYPSIAVITNIDMEHMETYDNNFDNVKESFIQFANRVPFYGCVILCIDDKHASEIISGINKRFITYGFSKSADLRATNIVKNGFKVSFDVELYSEKISRINLNMPGEYNIQNSLAAIAVAIEMQVPLEIVESTLEQFEGVQRRLSVRHDSGKYTVIDDYGHHPTEIMATLKAVKDAYPEHKIIAVFQPHRYTRTQSLMKELGQSFNDCDKLFITDIYAASEKPIEGINSKTLLTEARKYGHQDAKYLPNWDDILSQVDNNKDDKIVFITLGAGSITELSHEIAQYIRTNKK